MNIIVDRFISDSESTISRISVGNKFVCFGLEDEFRAIKKPKETRIPAGTYKIAVRTKGKHHQQYKERFKNIHRGMLEILNVPNFTDILIHCGNTHADTEGCLLVGTSAHTELDNMSVSSSGVAYQKFYPLVISAAEAGDLSITIVDNDR